MKMSYHPGIICVCVGVFFFVFYFINIHKSYAYDIKDLVEELDYLSNRDAILSKNIANINTPMYTPKDIKRRNDDNKNFDVDLIATKEGHFGLGTNFSYKEVHGKVIEIKPNGNKVSIENELALKDSNMLKFREIANLHKNLYQICLNAVDTDKCWC